VSRPGSCSALSLALGEPLFATASEASAWLLVEQPGPWGHSALVESGLDPEVGAELQARAKTLGIKALLVKQAGSRRGEGRCFLGRSDQGASFLEEVRLDDSRDLLSLDLEALARGEGGHGRRVEGAFYLVCTNSRRDACCARLGRPVAAALAEERPGRVWECSHLGGHRFAANLVCLPDGLWYGRVTPTDAGPIVSAYERGQIVLGHLRGRSSLPAAAQAADHFVRERKALTGLDDLAVERLDESDGETKVTLRGGGLRFHVRARGSEAEPPRPVSCREDKLDRPVAWSLVDLTTEKA
jgi:hypothetical protein